MTAKNPLEAFEIITRPSKDQGVTFDNLKRYLIQKQKMKWNKEEDEVLEQWIEFMKCENFKHVWCFLLFFMVFWFDF